MEEGSEGGETTLGGAGLSLVPRDLGGLCGRSWFCSTTPAPVWVEPCTEPDLLAWNGDTTLQIKSYICTLYVCTCTCMYVRTYYYVKINFIRIHVHMYIHILMKNCMNMYVHIYMYVYICTCVLAYIHTCTYVHVYMFNMYIRTYAVPSSVCESPSATGLSLNSLLP